MTEKEQYNKLNNALDLIGNVADSDLDIDQEPAVKKASRAVENAMSYFK